MQRRGVALLPAVAWGMTYGLVVLLAVSLARRQAFAIEPTALYLGAVLYLALGASVAAFFCYLTMLRRGLRESHEWDDDEIDTYFTSIVAA